jgi:hypothetical protein
MERAAAQQGGPVASGASFYSAAQAERGAAVFQSRCSGCHNTDLTGEKRGSARGGPALTGEQFMSNWEGENLDGLMTRLKTLMPRDDPGGLADEVYLDLLAFIAKVNALPGGVEPLTTEGVADLTIPQKAGSGTKALRNFKMVEVVGCLTQTDNVWNLRRTSEPIVTRDEPATTGELKAAETKPLGTEMFRLVSVTPFKPASSQGHKVLAKGLLYRAVPGPNRLNLTSLQSLGASCSL